MNSKAVDNKVKLIKYQVYLTPALQQALTQYISEQFSSDDRVVTAVIRKAIKEFLERRSYLGTENETH